MIIIKHQDSDILNFASYDETSQIDLSTAPNFDAKVDIHLLDEYVDFVNNNPTARVLTIPSGKNIFKVLAFKTNNVSYYYNFVVFVSKDKKFLFFDKIVSAD